MGNYREYQEMLEDSSKTELQELGIIISTDTDLTTNEQASLLAAIENQINNNKNLTNGNHNTYQLYDFDSLEVDLPSWETILNGKNLANFFNDVVLSRFFSFPQPEIQNKVITSFSLINSAAIPGKTAKLKKEAQLPILYLTGKEGSGKTAFLSFVQSFYNSDSFVTRRFSVR